MKIAAVAANRRDEGDCNPGIVVRAVVDLTTPGPLWGARRMPVGIGRCRSRTPGWIPVIVEALQRITLRQSHLLPTRNWGNATDGELWLRRRPGPFLAVRPLARGRPARRISVAGLESGILHRDGDTMDLLQLLQFVLHFDRHLGSAIAQHGTAVYVILFTIIFVEIGIVPLFFLPGDSLLFISGAFCASGALSIWIVGPVLFAATALGSALCHWSGRAVGHRVFTRDYRWLDKAALLRTHAFYEKHGGLTFLLSPFIAVIRTFAPFVAGVAAMTFARFLAAVVAGAAIWVVTLVIGGYYFGNVPIIHDHMNAIVLFGVGIGVGSLAIGGMYRFFKLRAASR
jgi:membrane-associated protein